MGGPMVHGQAGCDHRNTLCGPQPWWGLHPIPLGASLEAASASSPPQPPKESIPTGSTTQLLWHSRKLAGRPVPAQSAVS